MSEKVKGLAKRRAFVLNAYLTWMLFRRMPLRDIFDLEKIALFWKVAPYTMTNYQRLSQIYEFARSFEKADIKGAFVECGTWRGGGAGVMAYVAHRAGQDRGVWVFDAFGGLPSPTIKDGRTGQKGYRINEMFSIGHARYLMFSKLRLNEANVHIEKGLFQETVTKSVGKIQDIAILRLDCDLYESNKCCLENLYSKVIRGGYVIINTYDSWEGTKRAVDEFLAANNANVELRKIDYGGRYFQKT
ncbi:MAG: hypothetical protein HY589_03855 [Candidatus Omnitrophica bacterium]|nr:hypothetical protein [Candidatus Omnitrophota bacterium]